MIFVWMTFFVAILISSISAFYSILGLTSIFAGSFWPIVIMASGLEVGKIVSALWLHKYWKVAEIRYKLYLCSAVVILMLLTSMGVFGFLSAAHVSQTIPAGDVLAKVQLFDEKIQTERTNIENARKSLIQLDTAVDQLVGRTTDDTGIAKSTTLRRAQTAERNRLRNEIANAQTEIVKLQEARAPEAAKVRKIEADVGPLRYLAALVYGENLDANLLEKAVRWVIILIVVVFDPLAITLLLAATKSLEWEYETRNAKIESDAISPKPDDPISDESPGPIERTEYEPDDGPLTDDQVEQVKESVFPIENHQPEPEEIPQKTLAELHPYLNNPVAHFKNDVPIQVYHPEKTDLELPPIVEPEVEPTSPVEETPSVPDDHKIQTEGVTKEAEYKELAGGYVSYHGKQMNKDVLRDLRPDLFLEVDGARKSSTNFGTHFPEVARPGDTFVRVDVLPNRVYKFNGDKWIAVNKDQTTSYLYDQEYIKYLVSKIDQGEYDVNLLSANEKQQIEEYLVNQNN